MVVVATPWACTPLRFVCGEIRKNSKGTDPAKKRGLHTHTDTRGHGPISQKKRGSRENRSKQTFVVFLEWMRSVLFYLLLAPFSDASWFWMSPMDSLSFSQRWKPSKSKQVQRSAHARHYLDTVKALRGDACIGSVVCGASKHNLVDPTLFVLRDYAKGVTEVSHILWKANCTSKHKVDTLRTLHQGWKERTETELVFTADDEILWILSHIL